jgi:hypothetical protein
VRIDAGTRTATNLAAWKRLWNDDEKFQGVPIRRIQGTAFLTPEKRPWASDCDAHAQTYADMRRI